ncbi:hypothetical protein [Microvirga sp. Mcv34]|uniref:hypothetical protein n=1 Tax=Microvirga sp. Mcv34 TaxID=2926016 RepID=UPI0021C8E390|nr:hypothetical protein [Microvirga sp. Mcv34]
MTPDYASEATFENLASCLKTDVVTLRVEMLIAAFRVGVKMYPRADLIDDVQEMIQRDIIAREIFTLCDIFGIDPWDPCNHDKLLKCCLHQAKHLIKTIKMPCGQ